MIDWVEVVVPVGAAEVDEIAALIALEVSAAQAGTEQRGDEIVFWVARDAAAAAVAEVRDAAARWHAAGASVDPARVRIATAVPEAEWRDAWKRYFKVSRLTRQIVVVPSWERFEPAAGDLPIALDPGMAFGTGTHASTRLVLEEMQVLADAGAAPVDVLDVGCGSGILAIAAAKLWPGARVVAVDNDPLAVDATRDNAAINAVAIDARLELPAGAAPIASPADAGRAAPPEAVRSSIASPADAGRAAPPEAMRSSIASPADAGRAAPPEAMRSSIASPADAGRAAPPEAVRSSIVLANIQAHVLRELRAALIERCAPGGTLILSGLLTPQAQPLADEFVAAGMRLVRVRPSGDDAQWSVVVLACAS